MPGLIDSHWHTMFAAPSMFQLNEGNISYLTSLAGVEAEATLMREFWRKHPEAEQALRNWHTVAEHSHFVDFADMRRCFGSAD